VVKSRRRVIVSPSKEPGIPASAVVRRGRPDSLWLAIVL